MHTQKARIIRPNLIRDSQGQYWFTWSKHLSIVGDEDDNIPFQEDGYILYQMGLKKIYEAVSLLIAEGYIEEEELIDPFPTSDTETFKWTQIKHLFEKKG